jgi:DNA-binding NarL/FixJ family response regulator
VVWVGLRGLLVLSPHSNRVRLARAIEAGAAGILHKSSLLEEIVDALPALRGALEISHTRRLRVFLGEGSRI